MTKNIKYKESFAFKKEDFFSYGISPYAVLKVFNTASTNHAELIGVGFEDMLKKNLLWVSMRIKFQILQMPNQTKNFLLLHIQVEKICLNMTETF